MATAGGARLTREEMKQQKAVEEARKAGTLPPEVDDDGNMINPHIPKYMADAPWYVNQQKGLAHQKANNKREQRSIGLDDHVRRGVLGKAATRFRKGACKNCGAMTHTAKECVERPRKIGAWKTNKDIKADEILPKRNTSDLNYDTVRDRWSGYDPNEFKKTVSRYEKAAEFRAKKKKEEREKQYKESEAKKKDKIANGEIGEGGSDSDSDDSSDDDADPNSDLKQSEAAALSSQKLFTVGTAVKSTVRNLRIREDTAKYLRNLDLDSAYYDPKSRSMRENPTPHLNPNDVSFAGDNYVRVSGDTVDMAKAQLFAWDASSRGNDGIHMQANPTELMLAQKEFIEKKKKLEDMKRKAVTERYGGVEHMKKPATELLLGDTEVFTQYGRDGKLINGQEEISSMSKYEEDVMEGNHTKVWGSYFDKTTMKWGYGCCWQTSRNCYCTGEDGKRALHASRNMDLSKAKLPPKLMPTETDNSSSSALLDKAKLYGEANMDATFDQKKLERAIKRRKELDKLEQDGALDDQSRKYNSFKADEQETAEDLEAYRLTRQRADDPMKKFMDKGSDYILPKE